MIAAIRSWFSPWWTRPLASVLAGLSAALVLTPRVQPVLGAMNQHDLFVLGASTAIGTCIVTWIALSSFAGRLYRKQEARRAAMALAAARSHNEKVEYYRAYPLVDHTLCTTCGWLGRFRSNAPAYTGTKVVGTAAAVGGTGIAALGCGGSVLGIGLILIGLPLLFVFGLGVIPIGIGTVLLTVGGTATTAGATVASSGASAAAGASSAARNAAAAPNQCPQCKNFGLIPALSPMAIHQIQNTPVLAVSAQTEAEKVIGSLPQVIELATLGNSKV